MKKGRQGGGGGEEEEVHKRKMKILCLHGYMQNADVFRKRTGALRRALKSTCEFVFLDAPYLIEKKKKKDDDDDDDDEEERVEKDDVDEGRAWFLAKENQRTRDDEKEKVRPSMSHEYTGWEEARAAICSAIVREDNNGIIDGILGFSQGATAAALYLAGERRIQHHEPIRFAVLFSGFYPRDESYANILLENASGDGDDDDMRSMAQKCKPLVPFSLHVTGKSDTFVAFERSKLLAECFSSREEYQHQGGHGIPTDKVFRDTLKRFVSDIQT